MFENINMSEIFISKLKSYYDKYKNNNGSIKKHSLQERYLSLLQFTYNCSYWSRFNKNPDTNKWHTNCMTGKYLNEIHLFLVKFNFYRSLYIHILNIYLKITNYETLKNISIDSCFIRNIQGYNLSRNPAYNNKPGLKVHALVDSNRVPISFLVTDCNVHDSVIVQQLIENIFIDKITFSKYCKIFLADSAYSGLITVEYITSIGLSIFMGRNNNHVKKIVNINTALIKDLKNYKKRGIVENFFGDFLRTPCLSNNYERSLKSYEGISLFFMSIYLAKKVNKLINNKNNKDLADKEKKEASIKKEKYEKRKAIKYKLKKNKKENDEKLKLKKDEKLNRKTKKIKNNVWSNVNKEKIKKKYDKSVRLYNNNNQVIKRGRNKDISYEKYERYMKDEMYRYMKDNILTQTSSYMFGIKKLHMLKAESHAFKKKIINNKMKNMKISKITNLFTDKFFNK